MKRFAFLQKHGGDARVLAGGQSLIPAMRFRLARPAVLVDINAVGDLTQLRIDGATLVIGAIARDIDIERAPWIGDRRWSLIHDASRVVADPVVRQMGTLVGSLCHNDPSGDWTAVALASRAEVVVRGKSGTPHASRSTSFWSTASRPPSAKARWRLAVRFPVPDDRTAGSYQKVERKVGDFATAAAAVQVSLNADGTIRAAGVALSAAGPCAVRVDEAERAAGRPEAAPRCSYARRPTPRRARARRRRTCAAASSTRSTSRVCSSPAACARRSSVWGCRYEGQRHSQRRQLRAGR